jgi:hypothetical protein
MVFRLKRGTGVAGRPGVETHQAKSGPQLNCDAPAGGTLMGGASALRYSERTMLKLTTLRPVVFLLGLALSPAAFADLALSSVSLANPGLPAVTVNLNGIFRNVLPSPFIITAASVSSSDQWFCLDPLQTIYHAGSGEPAGNGLDFASTDTADFDLWGLSAPGLSAARVQNLADLFQAYLPVAHTSMSLGAIQLAVWEIANEANANAFTLSTGYLGVTSYGGSGAASMILAANAMLASLTDQAVMNQGNAAALDFLIDGSYQRIGSSNRVLVQDLVGFTPVPEPSTYGMIGAAFLIGIVGFRRFRSTRSIRLAV